MSRANPMRRVPLLLLAVFASALFFGCTEAPEPEAAVLEEPQAADAPPWSQPAWVDDAVLYEVFVPDASPEGTFQGLIARLPELQALGVNTLWLMPIHPIGVEARKGVLGSPYAIRDFYGINPDYGTPEDFRALVDAIHARGMYVLLDLVANHTAPDNAWVTEHPDWYTAGPDGGPITPMSPEGEPTDWTDVVDLDYSNPELRAEMIDVMRYWVQEFDIDGYRCDVAGWVPYDFWEEAIAAVREVKPVLMLAEHADPEIHHVGFDLTYAWPEYGRLKEVWEGEPVAELIALVEEVEEALPAGAERLRFTTNHDETAWDAPPPALFGGQAGAQAAFVLTAALPGVPLVYNGQETGVEAPVPFFERTPYDWAANPEVRTFYDQILDLYSGSEALQTGATVFPTPDAEDVFMVERAATDAERVVVAVNVRDRPAPMPAATVLDGAEWTDALTGEPFVPSEAPTLPPYGYLILRAG